MVNGENFGNNYNDFKAQISDLREHTMYRGGTENAYKYLESELENVIKEGTLEKYIPYFREQITLQTKLQLERQKFDMRKGLYLSDGSITKINESFNELEGKRITDEDIKNLNTLIKNEEAKFERSIIFNETFRDYVEKNIDIHGTLEAIPPQGVPVHSFYSIFTKTYISFLENKFQKEGVENAEEKITKMHKDNSKGLFVTEQELDEILQQIFETNGDILSDFYNSFDVKLNNGVVVTRVINRDLQGIINDLTGKGEELEEKSEDSPIVLLSKPEESKEEQTPPPSTKPETRREVIPTVNFMEHVKRNMSERRQNDLNNLLQNSEISKTPILVDPFKANPPKNENYIRYIIEKGFTPEANKYLNQVIDGLVGQVVISEGVRTVITKEYIERNRVSMYNNLTVLFMYILHLEGNGQNLKNGGSSARGYGQILSTNGRFDNNGKRRYSSYELSLRNAYKHYNGEDKIYFDGRKFKQNPDNSIPQWIIDAYNEIDRIAHDKTLSATDRRTKLDAIGVHTLSAEKQTILIMAHTFEAGKEYQNAQNFDVSIETLLGHVAIGKSGSWAMGKIYEEYHHTSLKTERTNGYNRVLQKSGKAAAEKWLTDYNNRLERIRGYYSKFLMEAK